MTCQKTYRSKRCDFRRCSNVCQNCGDERGYSTPNCNCPLCEASCVSNRVDLKVPAFLLELWQSIVHCTRHHCDQLPPMKEKQLRRCLDNNWEAAEGEKKKSEEINRSLVSDERLSFENIDVEKDEYICSCCGQKLYVYFNSAAGRRVFTHSPTYTTDEEYASGYCNRGSWEPEVDIVLPCPYQRKTVYETTYRKSFRHPEVVAREASTNKGQCSNIFAMYHMEGRDVSPSLHSWKSRRRSFDSSIQEPTVKLSELKQAEKQRMSASKFSYMEKPRHDKRSKRKCSVSSSKSFSSLRYGSKRRSNSFTMRGTKSAHSLHCDRENVNNGASCCRPNESLCYLGITKRQNDSRSRSISPMMYKNSIDSKHFPFSKSTRRGLSVEPDPPGSPALDFPVLSSNCSKHSNVVSRFRKKKTHF